MTADMHTRAAARGGGSHAAWLVAAVAIVAGVSGLWGEAPSRDVRLTLSEGTSMAAALSPDGRTIAIDLLGALWTLGVDGGPAQRILDDGYDARLPAWSPDGQRIAFQAYRGSTWSIWTVNADGTGLQEVTSGPFDDREPHWSPDGARLAFSSDRSGNYDMWIVDARHAARCGRSRPTRPTTSCPRGRLTGARSRSCRIARSAASTPLAVEAGAERLRARPSAATVVVAVMDAGRQDAWPTSSVERRGQPARWSAARTSRDAGEDVFPFRAAVASAAELLYTADGEDQAPARAPAAPRGTIAFSRRRRVHARGLHARSAARFPPRRAAAGARA